MCIAHGHRKETKGLVVLPSGLTYEVYTMLVLNMDMGSESRYAKACCIPIQGLGLAFLGRSQPDMAMGPVGLHQRS